MRYVCDEPFGPSEAIVGRREASGKGAVSLGVGDNEPRSREEKT